MTIERKVEVGGTTWFVNSCIHCPLCEERITDKLRETAEFRCAILKKRISPDVARREVWAECPLERRRGPNPSSATG